VRWHDFEVVNERSGRPTLVLHGRADEIGKEIGVTYIHLSMTHTTQYGLANVIFEH
jgi:holo-[acyl-carrier protein] synthase